MALDIILNKRTRRVSINQRGFTTQEPQITEEGTIPGFIDFNISHLSQKAFELFSDDEIGKRVKLKVLNELVERVKDTPLKVSLNDENLLIRVLEDTTVEITKEEDGIIVPDITKSKERFDAIKQTVQMLVTASFELVDKYDRLEWFSGKPTRTQITVYENEIEYQGGY